MFCLNIISPQPAEMGFEYEGKDCDDKKPILGRDEFLVRKVISQGRIFRKKNV